MKKILLNLICFLGAVVIGVPWAGATVNLAGTGTGTVTSTPAGIGCGAGCNAKFMEGTEVTLTGTPNAGSALEGWSVADCTGNGDCKVTVSQDIAITATFDLDSDTDGISDATESGGPNGGDGNDDGIQDSGQNKVATFRNVSGNWTTMTTDSGSLELVRTTASPSPDDSPGGIDFSQGFFGFKITGLASGATAQVEIFIWITNTNLNKYHKYGPTASNPSNHWYAFDYDDASSTGAKIDQTEQGVRITLHLKDGGLGDDDLTVNGEIDDIGGPGDDGSPVNSGGNSSASSSVDTGSDSSGGCFLNTLFDR